MTHVLHNDYTLVLPDIEAIGASGLNAKLRDRELAAAKSTFKNSLPPGN